MKNLKISFSLRAFIIYFVILGSLSWYLVDNALERLNDGMRQSAESVMVDMAHLLATEIEQQFADDYTFESEEVRIDTLIIDNTFSQILSRQIEAKIYEITKTAIDTSVYITDKSGIVIYDSTGKATGEDYSKWRDVSLTLEGKYGARTSFIDQTKTDDDDEKIMVVAAPIRYRNDIIGVVSVAKSIKSLEGHLKTESLQLKNYALLLVLLAIAIGYLFSIWLTNSLEKISNYAQKLADGYQTTQPRFWDDRLDNLSGSVTTLRNKLDGKEYVEDYIHSLTHELKTPITSIRGAAELLLEDIPAEEQQRFIKNIFSSNQRMAQLVERMLSLAKLESRTELVDPTDFDLANTLRSLLDERRTLLEKKSIIIDINTEQPYPVNGDKMLIRQAIGNLIDNAISFCHYQGRILITFDFLNNDVFSISVFNQGNEIPDYALPKLYERFFSLPRPEDPRTSNSHSYSAKSTGLGLSFVNEIMKLHQGKVTIKNHTIGNTSGVIAVLKWTHSNSPLSA